MRKLQTSFTNSYETPLPLACWYLLNDFKATMNFRVPFVHIDYKSHLQNLFAPIVVSTNLKELAFDCQGTAAIAAKSGCPIVVLYAQVRRSALDCPSLFKRLCYFPQKVLSDSS